MKPKTSNNKTVKRLPEGSKRAPMTRRGDADESMNAREQIAAHAHKGFKEHVAGVEAGESLKLEGTALVDKADLEGVPFVILGLSIRKGEFKDKQGNVSLYASVTCQLEDDSVVVFNDGGTGILPELEAIAEVAEAREELESSELSNVAVALEKPIVCMGGLRVSQYQTPYGPAETWYLAPNAAKKRQLGANGAGAAPVEAGRRPARQQQTF